MLALFFTLLCAHGRWDELPTCPDEGTVLASKHSTATKEILLELINDAGIDAVIVWVNFDGNEIGVRLYALCMPADFYSMSYTYLSNIM